MTTFPAATRRRVNAPCSVETSKRNDSQWFQNASGTLTSRRARPFKGMRRLNSVLSLRHLGSLSMSVLLAGLSFSTRRPRLQTARPSWLRTRWSCTRWLPRSCLWVALLSGACGRFGYEDLEENLDASVSDESDASASSDGAPLTTSLDSDGSVTDTVFHSTNSTSSTTRSSADSSTGLGSPSQPGETSGTQEPGASLDAGTDASVTSPDDSTHSSDPASSTEAPTSSFPDTTTDEDVTSDVTSHTTSTTSSSTTSTVTSNPPNSTSDDSTWQCTDQQNQCGGDCAPCACYWDSLELLGTPNYVGNGLYSPTLSSDGLTLWFGLIVSGGPEQLAYATRPNQFTSFGVGTLATAPLHSNSWEGNPHLSADRLSLYFYSARNNEDLGLFRATRGSPGGTFDNVVELTTVNSTATEQLPWVTADERTLYFVSDRSGSRDIWKATRAQTSDPFSAPTPVSELNTAGDEGKISLTPDGLVAIFAAERSGGQGGLDIYRAARRSTSVPFEPPTLLTDLSTAFDDYDPELTRDGSFLYFVSTRTGDSAVWRARMRCD
jgi:hypothetical protein